MYIVLYKECPRGLISKVDIETQQRKVGNRGRCRQRDNRWLYQSHVFWFNSAFSSIDNSTASMASDQGWWNFSPPSRVEEGLLRPRQTGVLLQACSAACS